MPKRIPINQAKAFAIANDLKQVIIAGWDGKLTHIVTYGDTVEACEQAAMGGNKIKKALGWPANLDAEPSRVTDLKERVAMVESMNAAQSKHIKQLLAEVEQLKAGNSGVRPSVHVIQGTEFERGWGQRPDGYVAFPSKFAAELYITDYSKKFHTSPTAPDEYTNYDYIGVKECSMAFHTAVMKDGKKFYDKQDELLK
jgi:hypothetical protein